MPELPEVETVVRDLREHGLEGAVIRDVQVRWPRTVSGCSPASLAGYLRGRTIDRLSRRGKYIILSLDDGRHLQIHLRMTGKFRFAGGNEAPGKHDHIVITLTDGRCLFFNDTRKFGRFRLVGSLEEGLEALGPEPLGRAFLEDPFRLSLAGRTRMIKPLLLDQTLVAGLGNIYVDESLWLAGIHPERCANTLTPAEIRRLYLAIRKVLRRAVANCGTTLGAGQTNFYSVAGRRGRNADALAVFRRTGLACPRCARTIVRIVVGQRGTHLCPTCQK
jgi:formamidopyrimidine-DNA glycosylase